MSKSSKQSGFKAKIFYGHLLMVDKSPLYGPVGPTKQQINIARSAFRRHHSSNRIAIETVAKLTKDTQSAHAETGFRGCTTDRELLFQCGESEIAISINSDNTGQLWTVRGQIFVDPNGENLALNQLGGIALTLSSFSGDTRLGLTDALGRFRLSGLGSGKYQLKLESEGERLIIEELAL